MKPSIARHIIDTITTINENEPYLSKYSKGQLQNIVTIMEGFVGNEPAKQIQSASEQVSLINSARASNGLPPLASLRGK